MNTENPLVSIITPFYNAENYIGDTIKTVLNQTYSNWELLLVDDGSVDGSAAIASSFKDARIRLIRQKNAGQGAATNNAIDLAQGEFFQFLDADDLMHRQKTENQIRDLIEHKEYLGVSKWAFFRHQPSDANFKMEPVFFSGDSIDWVYELWTNDTMMHTNSYMISRDLLRKGGSFFDVTIELNVDFEFFTRMALAAKGVIYTKDAIAYYRKGVQGSKTFKPSKAKQLSALEARVKSIGYLLDVEDSEKTRDAARMAITILTYSYPALLSQSKIHLARLGISEFGDFGGSRFKTVSSIIGFKNTLKLKSILSFF